MDTQGAGRPGDDPGSTSTSPVYYGSTVAAAKRMLDRTLRKDPTVKFLLEAIAKQGCALDESFFQVKECDAQAAGGFLPGEGVILCANHVALQDEVNTIVAHELVHAFDHCRAKNMDWGDLKHHACSEIRAANLSGQCHLNRELLLQGVNFKFREGHTLCVKRKAQLSVAMNPYAMEASSISSTSSSAEHPGKSRSDEELRMKAAKDAVESVWNRCYNDTSPFTGIP